MRWLTRILFTAPLLLMLMFFIMLGTETGSRWVMNIACRLSGMGLSVDHVYGRLLGSMSLEGVRVSLPAGEISVDTADWNWQSAALFNGQIRLPYLNVSGVTFISAENKEQQPEDSGGQLPSLAFPLMLLVDNFVLKDVTVEGADGALLYLVNSLHVKLEGFKNSVLINNFELKAPGAALKLHGRITLAQDWQVDLLGNWNLAGFGFNRMEGTFSVAGPVAAPHLELGVYSPGQIRVDADLFNLFEDPQWTLRLKASKIDLAELIQNCPHIEITDIQAVMQGDMSHYQGKVTALGAWDELTGVNLKSDLEGDSRGIEFRYLRVDRTPGYLQMIDGHISWAETFAWQGNFQFKDFDLGIIDRQLQGIINADIVSGGKVVENGVMGSFEIIGLEAELQGRKVSAKGQVTLEETAVSTQGLTIHSEGIEGVASIDNAYFSWLDKMAWYLHMRLDSFNPGFLSPELVGSVSGEIDSRGYFLEKGPEVQVKVKSLSGTLRDREISGEGALRYTGDTIESQGLVLKSGQSVLTVSGKKENDLSLAFSFTSPDLKDLLADAQGQIQLDGNLSGTMQYPRLQLSLDGKDLALNDKAIRELNLQFRGELTEQGAIAARAGLKGVQLGTPVEFDGEIGIQGSLVDHDIDVYLGAGDTAIELFGSGTYQDSWHGSLDDFTVESAEFGRWTLREAVALSFGAMESSIENLCLTEEDREICFTGQVDRAESVNWQGLLRWKAIPMDELYKAGLPKSPLKGLLGGSLAFTGESSSLLDAELKTDLVHPLLEFDMESEEMQVFPLDSTTLTLKIAENEVESRVLIHSSESGSLDLNVGLAGGTGLGLPPASYLDLPVRGRLVVDNFNSEILAAYTEYMIEPKGPVRSDFTIEGSMNNPQLHGDLFLEKGGIAIPSQGVLLEDFKVSLTARENGATVNCTAKSGPGSLTAQGYVGYGKDGLGGDFKITGENFLLVHLPEYVLRVSPEVQFQFSKEKGEMKGKVKVPYALITPEEMTGSVKESPDVIFVEGEQEIKETGWPFYLDLNVLLGEEVSVEGYGLTGKLGGELKVKISPDDFITGIGELLLREGVFTIYGRSLDIERGLVKFTGGPIDNPGVDVRAKKTVSDKEAKGEGYTVGVDISGLTQDLKFQLFSYPFMEETEILSYMIAGHSLSSTNTEEGNMLQSAAKTLGIAGSGTVLKGLGEFLTLDDLHLEGSQKDEDISLVVGKNLTKDLYVGYDINLFSELGEFRVRYDLDHGFWVETKSSSESTSAELFYSFER